MQHRFGRFLLLAALVACGSLSSAADPLVDESVDSLLSKLVQAALKYDIYNGRCRHFTSSMHADNVEKLAVSRFGLTVSQIIQGTFHQDPVRFKGELEQQFLEQVRRLGGCSKAKQQGYLRDLDRSYRDLVDQASNLP